MPTERRHDMGAGGECICPKCETRVPHQNGVPCQEVHCPSCGAKMLREGSEHYTRWKTRRDQGQSG